MNKFVRFLILLVIVSLSCSSVTDVFTEPALVEVTGPILGMTVAASLDEQGQPVNASFTYPVDQPEMVVLVRIGEVDPGPLTFSWYRVTEAGDEALFEQTVAVEARDTAFSSGLNPGILAAGTYKVVATFAGGSETIVWDVVEPQTDGLAAPLDTSASAAGGTAAPGPSGTTPTVIPQPGTQNVSGAEVTPIIYLWDQAPQFKFLVMSGWRDAQKGSIISPKSFKVQVSTAITGSASASREFTHPADINVVTKDYSLNPCTLPGGSDLPGTSITVTAVALGYEANKQTLEITLGPDTSSPIVQLDSKLSDGAKIEEGDKIELSAIAEELKSGGSWQTGVSKIEIFVMEPFGEELLTEKYDEYKERSCGAKSWKQTTKKITYEVPKGVKGDIRICAFGYDFKGNPPGKKCYTYHTGDKLKGKLNRTLTGSASDGTTTLHQLDSDLSLTLQEDGTLVGIGQTDFAYNLQGPAECGSHASSIGPVQFTSPINGEWTRDAIVFRFTTDTPIMAAETGRVCDIAFTSQFDIGTNLLGIDFQANWDGQAYTWNQVESYTVGILTNQIIYTIHLEPPAPAVGFSPGLWAAASADQASMLLVSP